MYVPNPKQAGANIWDCTPQTGKCPIGCNQCFCNRADALYYDNTKPNIPDPIDVGNDVVRMNAVHDSNINRELVIATAGQFKHVFFNTSIPNFDFPGPVVLTINPCEEEPARAYRPPTIVPPNLMFVRIRTSASNLGDVHRLVMEWGLSDVPIVITFMAYYDEDVMKAVQKHRHPFLAGFSKSYEYKTRHINKYWCPTRDMKVRTMKSLGVERSRLLTMCGTFDSEYCKDCHNCESFFWMTRRRIDAIKDIKSINKRQ